MTFNLSLKVQVPTSPLICLDFVVHILDDENLEAIRASVKLESRLQTLLGSNVSSGLDWAILERLTPLLHLWVVNQLNLLDQWYERIWAKEDWTPLNPNGGPAR